MQTMVACVNCAVQLGDRLFQLQVGMGQGRVGQGGVGWGCRCRWGWGGGWGEGESQSCPQRPPHRTCPSAPHIV